MKQFKFIKNIFKKHPFYILILLFFKTMFSTSFSFTYYFNARLLQNLIENKNPYIWIIIIFGLITLASFSIIFSILIENHLNNKVVSKLQIKYNKYNIENNISKYKNIKNSDYLSDLTNSTDKIKETLQSFFEIYVSIIGLISLFISIYLLNWLIAILLFAIFLFSKLFLLFLINIYKKKIDKQFIVRKKYYQILNDFTEGFKTLLENNKGEVYHKKITPHLIRYKFANISLIKLENKKIFLENFAANFIRWLIYLMLGILIILWDLKMIAIFSAVLGAIYNVNMGLSGIINSIITISSNSNVLNSFFSKITKKKKNELKRFKINENSITFSKVNFNYKNKNVLENKNIKIKENEKVLIYGPSGSGKSTTIKLILKILKPKNGSILIGNKNYQSINELDLFENISYIDKNSIIFEGNLKENISFSNENFDYKKYSQICKILNIDFINVKASYKDLLKLSTGQVQRMALARALYKKHNILILDEAISNLDKKNMSEILNNIFKLNKTIIVISHNLNKLQIEYFDQIFKYGKM